MSAFHSVVSANLPSSGVVGDVYFCTNNSLLYAVVGDGSLVQLLISTPIPVAGPQGPIGLTGPQGIPFTSTIQFSGEWKPSPVSYLAGAVTSFNSFLYLALAQINISDNTMNPQGNRFWQLLAPSGTVGKTSAIIAVMDGVGSTPSPGSKFFQLPYSCVVSSYSILADQPGSAQFDVKWSSFANMPATVSITGSAKPTLTAAQKVEVDISSLWAPSVFASTDVLEIALLSVTTCTVLTLQIFVTAL